MGKDQRVSEDSKDALANGAGLLERVCSVILLRIIFRKYVLNRVVGWEDFDFTAHSLRLRPLTLCWLKMSFGCF